MNTLCRQIRKDILRVAKESGHGHLPTCFSVVEMLYAVYAHMRHDPKNPTWEDRDLFVLSKGHAALAQYCVLAHVGYFDVKEVSSYGSFLSPFGCHADRAKVPGVELSTGSLGHGIGFAAGAALALSVKRSPRQVYTLIGDGEANEGSVWEALMVAADRELKNLTVLLDNNQSQVRCLQLQNVVGKCEAFGCETYEVDGHDLDDLARVLQAKSETVKMIVANTTKGFGSRTLSQSFLEWHRRSPNPEEYEKLLGELDA